VLISLYSDGTIVHKRGTLVQIAGDNLGLNQLCGFVESFSAMHFCRLCTISKAEYGAAFTEDGLELRNKEQYSHQLKSLLEGTISHQGLRHQKQLFVKQSAVFSHG
jgi:hypothetical protein